MIPIKINVNNITQFKLCYSPYITYRVAFALSRPFFLSFSSLSLISIFPLLHTTLLHSLTYKLTTKISQNVWLLVLLNVSYNLSTNSMKQKLYWAHSALQPIEIKQNTKLKRKKEITSHPKENSTTNLGALCVAIDILFLYGRNVYSRAKRMQRKEPFNRILFVLHFSLDPSMASRMDARVSHIPYYIGCI